MTPAVDLHPDAVLTWRPQLPVDVRLSLSPLRRGAGDPTYSIGEDGALWRTSRMPSGPATLRLVQCGLREVTAPSCHDEPKKCEGREIIPLLPVALKTLEVATLAAQGQDWRAALRTRPDGWEAYQSHMKRGAKPKVCIGICSRRP